jgi:hypothetical protein
VPGVLPSKVSGETALQRSHSPQPSQPGCSIAARNVYIAVSRDPIPPSLTANTRIRARSGDLPTRLAREVVPLGAGSGAPPRSQPGCSIAARNAYIRFRHWLWLRSLLQVTFPKVSLSYQTQLVPMPFAQKA